jgi:ubiquinone biosynthesis accessory factor UbiJ
LSDAAAIKKATPGVAFCFLANQLLAREDWARARLAPYRGQAFEVRAPLLAALRLHIAEDGRVAEGGGDPAALVTPAGVTGSTALADELRHLAKHLRPDVAEELSAILGDVAAERIVGTARGLMRWQADSARRLVEAFADFAIQERGMLVRRAELADLGARLQDLDARLEQLAMRVDRLA